VTGKRTWRAVFGLALLGSQAGHLLAYQLRFGAVAQQVQSSGVHAYFPVLAKTTLGVIAAALLAGLFLIGMARVLTRRPAARTTLPRPVQGRGQGRGAVSTFATPSYLGVLAILFTVQLACFVGQEVGEAMVAGLPVDSAPHLVLWGTLGQLPVAALGAIALGWLARRYESAVDDLGAVLGARRTPAALVDAAIPVWVTPPPAPLLSQVAGASLGRRAPPSSMRFSSY
jgi:hypothetical protein